MYSKLQLINGKIGEKRGQGHTMRERERERERERRRGQEQNSPAKKR